MVTDENFQDWRVVVGGVYRMEIVFVGERVGQISFQIGLIVQKQKFIDQFKQSHAFFKRELVKKETEGSIFFKIKLGDIGEEELGNWYLDGPGGALFCQR